MTVDLCRRCHVARHVRNNDWARWGQIGGKHTAQNPVHWRRNLKQFKLHLNIFIDRDPDAELLREY